MSYKVVNSRTAAARRVTRASTEVDGPLRTASTPSEQGTSFIPGRVSIVVPLHRDSLAFRRCIASCARLIYPDYEVIVVSDREVSVPSDILVILTGSPIDTGPGEKRDIGMRSATGEYFAFIDDDAYPDPRWLTAAMQLFSDRNIGAAAGPGLTPPHSTWAERLGGSYYESVLGSGPYLYRFTRRRARTVDDYPAYNLLIRRAAAEAVNGWGTRFYGGEDTVICSALVKAGWRIVYSPDVVVYHHRRSLPWAHARQVRNVGRHRGYFVKAYPETSRRPVYFVPLAAVVAWWCLLAGAVCSRRRRRAIVNRAGCGVVLAATVGLFEQRDPAVGLALPFVLIFSHTAYAVGFLEGLLKRSLDR